MTPLSEMLHTALLNKSPQAKLLLYPLIRELEACPTVEAAYRLNEEIAAFCSHVRNSIEKDNQLITKQISK